MTDLDIPALVAMAERWMADTAGSHAEDPRYSSMVSSPDQRAMSRVVLTLAKALQRSNLDLTEACKQVVRMRAEAAENAIEFVEFTNEMNDEFRLLREQLDNVNASLAYVLRDENRIEDADGLDLDLLRKPASGDGGRRTGALQRAGLLTWEVTAAGHAAIGEHRYTDSGAVTGCGCEICRLRGKDG